MFPWAQTKKSSKLRQHPSGNSPSNYALWSKCILITTSSASPKHWNTKLVFLILKLSKSRCCAPSKFFQLLLDHWQPDCLIWSPLTAKRKLYLPELHTQVKPERQKVETARESESILTNLSKWWRAISLGFVAWKVPARETPASQKARQAAPSTMCRLALFILVCIILSQLSFPYRQL